MRRALHGGWGVGVLVGVILGKSMRLMGTMNSVVPLHSHLGKCGMAVRACAQLCAGGMNFWSSGRQIVVGAFS
jgi:hypothetical protein